MIKGLGEALGLHNAIRHATMRVFRMTSENFWTPLTGELQLAGQYK